MAEQIITDKAHNELLSELKDLLAKAEAFYYHDFKSPEYPAPKMELSNRLRVFRNKVLSGKYDNK